MQLTHRKMVTVIVGVLILLCWAWWPRQEALPPQLPDSPAVIDPDHGTPPVTLVRDVRPVPRRVHDPECGTCSSMLATAEEWKRSAPTVPEAYSGMMDDTDCFGRLRQAAANGIVNVNTQDLGGCNDRTPLHVASTPDQVRALLEAGADVNAQDEYGYTVLHSHAVPLSATESSIKRRDRSRSSVGQSSGFPTLDFGRRGIH